jgi:phosphatidylserine/phosphatidylglycerophosphate/cardiolipin synthase-like enzyme
MVCPWVSQYAVNTDMQQYIQETFKRNQEVKIHIGWGNLYDIEKLGIQSLQELLTNGRYNAISIFQRFERIQLKLLGTHEKFLICDDKWALITSYNFLSASDFKSEREVALLTYDKNIIADLINHYENSPSLQMPQRPQRT